MNGLTRKEKTAKTIIIYGVRSITYNEKHSRNSLLVHRVDPSAYGMVQHMEFEDIWAKLYDEAKAGWSDKHEQLCERLVKGQPFFEKLWKWKMSKR